MANLSERERLLGSLEPISYEAFLERTDLTFAEWVDGEVIVKPSETSRHQDLVVFLSTSISVWIEERDLGWTLSRFQIKLAPNLPGREPDFFFVRHASPAKLHTYYLEGPADLTVEIASLKSRARDRGEKFYEYEQAGVKEYWLIDPEREQAEFYLLDERGVYQAVPLDDGVFRSEVLEGLGLDTSWLWQEPLPPLMFVLKAWALV